MLNDVVIFASTLRYRLTVPFPLAYTRIVMLTMVQQQIITTKATDYSRVHHLKAVSNRFDRQAAMNSEADR
jgi:hypothetical protein